MIKKMTYPALITNSKTKKILRVPFLLVILLMTMVSDRHVKDILMATAIVLFIILVISFNATPKSYTISADKLVINRPIFDKVIQRDSIGRSTLIDRDKAIEESNNFFSKINRQVNNALNRLTNSTKDFPTSVFIITKENRKFIITVSDPEKFIAELNSSNAQG